MDVEFSAIVKYSGTSSELATVLAAALGGSVISTGRAPRVQVGSDGDDVLTVFDTSASDDDGSLPYKTFGMQVEFPSRAWFAKLKPLALPMVLVRWDAEKLESFEPSACRDAAEGMIVVPLDVKLAGPII